MERHRSASDAADLVHELGGAQPWADAVGSVPVAAFTVTKLRWLARAEPDHAARVARVMLPHDWLTWRLAGRPEVATTDRGDASGTGYWSPATGEYRTDLLVRAFGRELGVPRVAGPAEVIGETGQGIALAAGTGDNMAAALGLGLESGDMVVSLGTSGTAFAVAASPSHDPSGQVAGFADATGRWLPLVCTLNAARVLTSTATLLGVDLDGLSDLALAARPGAAGLTLLPYLDGERTPRTRGPGDRPGRRLALAGRGNPGVAAGARLAAVRLAVTSEGTPFPAEVGWHPWFRRRLARGGDLTWKADAVSLLERGADHLPTGRRLDPTLVSGPYDDAFEVPDGRVELRWPGALRMECQSDVRWFVVFDELSDLVCIEPETAPPGLSRNAPLVRPGSPRSASVTWSWDRGPE